jgi:hypothetical protein
LATIFFSNRIVNERNNNRQCAKIRKLVIGDLSKGLAALQAIEWGSAQKVQEKKRK